MAATSAHLMTKSQPFFCCQRSFLRSGSSARPLPINPAFGTYTNASGLQLQLRSEKTSRTRFCNSRHAYSTSAHLYRRIPANNHLQAHDLVLVPSLRPTAPQVRQILQHRTFASDNANNPAHKVEASNADDANRSNLTTNPTPKLEAPTILKTLRPKERHENIYTLPNILTFSRLLATPVIGYSILTSHPHLALALFAYAGITDAIDGWLARHFNSQTVLGTIIDPMADKALMTTVVVCCTLQGLIPTWLAVVILGRDVALAISAIYFRYISLPPPKTFTRYWDFSLPSAEVRPTEISKINTLLQLLLIGNAMVLPALPTAFVDAWNLMGVFEGWQYLVASTTVWSGLSYVWNKDAVKILSEEEVKAKMEETRGKSGEEVKK